VRLAWHGRAQGIAALIVPSKHGNSAGIVGALFLGSKALGDSKQQAVPITDAVAAGATAALQPFSSFCLGVAAGLALALVAAKTRK
jgi:hypothetical protein